MKMYAYELVMNLLYPPVCVHCKKLLGFDSVQLLCDSCKEIFEREKSFDCPICRQPHYKCTCTPPRMKIDKSLHLSEYSSEESVTRSIILLCKDKKYKRMFSFVACEIADLIRSHTDNFDNSVICYVPRDPRKKLSTGLDQSEYTARLIANKLGIENVRAIARSSAKEQKRLRAAEREKNASLSYKKIDKKLLFVFKKDVILYDDVMTTGASLHACARLLKEMGAKSVTTVTFGRTYIEKNKNKQT